jgi:hypothetical protein
MIELARRGLPRSHRACGLTTEIAAHRDVLWIDRPGELTAVSSAAIIGKRADQLISGRDKHPQGCC